MADLQLIPGQTSVERYLAVAPLLGLPASNFVPPELRAQAISAAQKNPPQNAQSVRYKGKTVDTTNQAAASVIARGLIYWRDGYVPCGRPGQPIDFSAEQIGGEVANSIGSGITAMTGIPLPGLGQAIALIQSIFAHHAQAVAKEQDTICKVGGVIQQVLARYDMLVREGTYSPASAAAAIQHFLAQINGNLSTISTSNPCNAGCVITSFIAAHSDFVPGYYSAIAPASFFSSAPGSAFGNLTGIPGGVITAGEEAIAAPLALVGIKLSSQQLLGLVVIAILILIGWAVYK
jgi:hypothetical protein